MAVPAAPAKAELHTEKHKVIKFLFNPAELTLTKSASWNAAETSPTQTVAAPTDPPRREDGVA